MKRSARRCVVLVGLCSLFAWSLLPAARGQTNTVVFEDDFSSDTIDPTKYQPDAPFFEGGVGDIHAEPGDGVMRFVGTTSQQWWSGSTLRVVPTFTATEQTPVTITIDRVAEAGVGTASRSALWILDESGQNYVLFADVRAEGGWHYNRKIGQDGDVPTGSGPDIAAFNGGTFDDGGLHQMSMVANGSTVKLYVDGQLGVEIPFPFSEVVFHFGSYARADNDTADTTWDNLKIETVVQPPNILFEDDFSANTIDPARYEPDSPFFEGGVGDVHAEAGDGVMRFVGMTTQQWWSGGTLRIVPIFAPSEAEEITISIDRVAEAGVGTASRSALWILDETRNNYVLFADVRGEGGWTYNRKIGEDGDVPTGGGTDIAAFNGGNFDDGGLHRMGMIADGSTVKLLLDGIEGAEVRFPFSPVIFEFGSYARADNDTADTTWDNLRIESTGAATFNPTDVSVRNGQLSPPITVRIPQGLNSQNAVQVTVTSSDAAVAVPEGGTGSSLNLTFPAGGTNITTFRVRGAALGGAEFRISGAIAGGNELSVAVISDPGVVLEETFAGASIDMTKWEVSQQGFESGTGVYTVGLTDGNLEILGTTETDFWPGASLKTVNSYVATPELNLVFEVDRVRIDPAGTAARTGVFITTDDRSEFVFFGQNYGETFWEVNVNPGNPTGSGTALAPFAADQDIGDKRLKLVADGRTVEVFLDDVSGGRFPFEVTTGIHFEIGAYARASGDVVGGYFDNVRIENVLPCISVSPPSVSMTLASTGSDVTVTVPQLLNDAAPVAVTVTSRDPQVAIPAGAVNGVLTLNFAAGAPNTQTISVQPVGKGATTFDIASTPQACVSGSLAVEVVAVPLILLSDDFEGTAPDPENWTMDQMPFDPTGIAAAATSAIAVSNGLVHIDVTAESPLWPGLALFTTETFTAAATTPVTFEIDRVSIGFVLTTGTGAEQRTGIWIREANGNFVFFSDYLAHDGRNFGWRYNKMTGAADDNPVDAGVNIAAFDGGTFDNRGNHRMRMVANGATVKLYLDDLFGAEVPFPFTQGLAFGFGAYVDEAGNVVRGKFDNASIRGGEDAALPTRLTAALQGGNIVITWTETGTLEESAALGPAAAWMAVTPQPTGNTHTVPVVGSAGARFYRVAR
jgi:hypothetical protein